MQNQGVVVVVVFLLATYVSRRWFGRRKICDLKVCLSGAEGVANKGGREW